MAKEDEKKEINAVSLTRLDVLRALMATATTSELRFQGVNLVKADLSRLDLRHINFKVNIFLISIYRFS